MKTAAIIVGAAVILIGGYFALRALYAAPEEGVPQAERVALSGTYVCLPLKESASSTGTCAPGVRTDDGVYYAADWGFMSHGMEPAKEGDTVTASGIITPIERLSTDYWQKYEVAGIFTATDSLEIKTPEVVSSSTLTNRSWVWQESTLLDGTAVRPNDDSFVLRFHENLSYDSTTDCNSLSGTYVTDAEVLSLASPVITEMFCEGSKEGEYVSQLVLTNSYVIEGDTLRLNLNRDFGTMLFKAQ